MDRQQFPARWILLSPRGSQDFGSTGDTVGLLGFHPAFAVVSRGRAVRYRVWVIVRKRLVPGGANGLPRHLVRWHCQSIPSRRLNGAAGWSYLFRRRTYATTSLELRWEFYVPTRGLVKNDQVGNCRAAISACRGDGVGSVLRSARQCIGFHGSDFLRRHPPVTAGASNRSSFADRGTRAPQGARTSSFWRPKGAGTCLDIDMYDYCITILTIF